MNITPIKCKSVDDYRNAIQEAINDQWGGSFPAYCEYSGVPYSSLAKFMRGDYETLRPINMRVIKEDLGIELEERSKNIFPSKGGVGIKMYTNSVPGKLVTAIDGRDLYNFAREHRNDRIKVCQTMNDQSAVEKYNCSSVIYLNRPSEV